jgi:Flp pilus assembly protein TadG
MMTAAAKPQKKATFLRTYIRKEDGSISVFTLMLFVLMLLMGGIAVDMMRYEHTRVTLQQTMDRSVLAAASLQQTLQPEQVVQDYFDKAGIGEQLDPASISVQQTMNSRRVAAEGLAISENFFMSMMGIDELPAPASAAAEQRRTNVEIILVLDVSGSMSTNDKIGKLKTAAKSFVDTVLANDTSNRVSIGIVPYNAQVNLGSALRSKYNAVNVHGVANVNCLEVPASTYSTLSLSRTLAIPMFSYADTTNSTTKDTSYYSETGSNATNSFQFCNPSSVNIVRMPTNNIPQLKANIDGLQAGGNTSIMLGMRWGVALMDPAAGSIYDEFITAGVIPSAFSNRPFEYDDEDAMKVIILMTDGAHVAHTFVKTNYKTGNSNVYRSNGDGKYSIRHTTGRPAVAGTNEYYVPHTNTWQASAYNSGSGTTRQTWVQVWSNLRVEWVAWQFYARALGTSSTTRTNTYNTWMNNFEGTFASVSAMDSSLQESCTLAKGEGVIVYGIAFEAPEAGQTQIQGCSSVPKSNHYFNANGLQISTVFQTIAANISQLRLTQ